MVGLNGFEPLEWRSQSPLPYRLAIALRIKKMVEGDGFEPSNSERADLQSAAFSHFATPPWVTARIITIALLLYNIFTNMATHYFIR